MKHDWQTCTCDACTLQRAYDRQLCGCGSGLRREAHHDARGIFLCYACTQCEREKLSHYRSDVLTDLNYWADEPIEEDE
jgi:hypothetical protein